MLLRERVENADTDEEVTTGVDFVPDKSDDVEDDAKEDAVE